MNGMRAIHYMIINQCLPTSMHEDLQRTSTRMYEGQVRLFVHCTTQLRLFVSHDVQ